MPTIDIRKAALSALAALVSLALIVGGILYFVTGPRRARVEAAQAKASAVTSQAAHLLFAEQPVYTELFVEERRHEQQKGASSHAKATATSADSASRQWDRQF